MKSLKSSKFVVFEEATTLHTFPSICGHAEALVIRESEMTTRCVHLSIQAIFLSEWSTTPLSSLQHVAQRQGIHFRMTANECAQIVPRDYIRKYIISFHTQ